MNIVSSADYDAVVIGAGLGGLLAAAAVAQQDGAVLVIERLPYAGGRFTTVQQAEYEITTGALHMVPHGSGGVLAQMLHHLGLPFRGVQSDVYASFFIGGKHIIWKNRLDVLRLFEFRGKLDLLKILVMLSLNAERNRSVNFAEWLESQTDDQTLRRCFERFAHFALSARPGQLCYQEMRAVFRSIYRYGMPQIPMGGCKSIIEHLEAYIRTRGGEVRVGAQVTRILYDGRAHRVCGVEFRDRRTGDHHTVRADVIVSDVGPRATAALLDGRPSDETPVPSGFTEAAGLKLHLVSEKSLIGHNGIMFCLDTKRICGIVEVSRSVPSLVPAGMHMLNTFQVLLTDDLAKERDLALSDLRYVFGSDFDRYCRVVRTSGFRGAWPVNHVIQGQDPDNQQPVAGLLMVGDGFKPPGHIMVEGVAASVRRVIDHLAPRRAHRPSGERPGGGAITTSGAA